MICAMALCWHLWIMDHENHPKRFHSHLPQNLLFTLIQLINDLLILKQLLDIWLLWWCSALMFGRSKILLLLFQELYFSFDHLVSLHHIAYISLNLWKSTHNTGDHFRHTIIIDEIMTCLLQTNQDFFLCSIPFKNFLYHYKFHA